ncbi:MAG TPA: Uma2 family endonuclease [Candidatus Tectomicrobia bacterium]|nr:Uma2 family endonuclease [Candidatus Tectomicrobia bacterium]
MPERRLWTREEFDRAEELGLFGPEERLELIEGEILVKEVPVNPPHATAQVRTAKALSRVFTQGYTVRGQLPLALGRLSKPLPDIAVVVGSDDDYEEEHPTTAVLIVEIAETSLRLDRTYKVGLCARAGIPDYWILNLTERILEVYRQPIAMRGRALGHGYASVTLYRETDTLSPLAAPEATLAIGDLLPRRRSEA